jgi:hypothetical protein
MSETAGTAGGGSLARVRGYWSSTYGADLVERASARPELWGFLFLAAGSTFVYLLTGPSDPQALDYFNRLADAFLNGRYWLLEAPSWLNELVPIGPGQWVVPYPPMPAVLALPFVALFGSAFPAQVYSAIYAGLAVGVVYLVLGRLGLHVRYRDRLALSGVFAFGTVFWYIAISGSAWYFAHVSAVLLFSLAVLAALSKQPAWVAGLLLGLATLCRLPVGLALPFVAAAQLGLPGWTELRERLRTELPSIARTAVLFGIGIGVPALIYIWFNLERWGTITDQSYVLIPGVLEDPIYVKHGILSPWYIPRNVFAIFFRSWNYVDDPPFLQPSWWGLGIFLTTPLFLWLFKARIRDPRVGWAALATLLVAIPILMHGNVGVSQFGYRFSLDFQVLLFVILATVVARGWTRLMTTASIASVVFCAYALWAISIDFAAY